MFLLFFYKVHYVQKDCLKVQVQLDKQMSLYDSVYITQKYIGKYAIKRYYT